MDASTPGGYRVAYMCQDISGHFAHNNVRNVKVVAAATDLDPVVTVEPQSVTVTVGGSFEAPAVACIDPEDGDLSSRVTVLDLDLVDAGTPGRCVVFYHCEDNSGNADAGIMEVIVVEPGS